MKRKLLLAAISILTLTGCGGGGENTSIQSSQPTGGSSSQSQTKSSESVEVLTDKQRFCRAKDNSFKGTAYEYTYEANASIKYKGATSFSGAKIAGKVQWNKNAEGSQYLAKRVNSGLLLIDSTTYKYNVGTDLITISEDESKDFSIVNHESITSGFDFEANSIGCILKAIEEKDWLQVTKDYSGKYKLSFNGNFGQEGLLKALKFIDTKKIMNAINKLTSTELNTTLAINSYSTLDSSQTHLNKFHFDASINVAQKVEITFSLDQSFTSFANNITLDIPSYLNTYVTASDIDSHLGALKTKFDSNKEKYYKYDLKTNVDHGVSLSNPLGLGVGSHSQGYAERSKINDEVFFHNGLELDSDYKNKDQFPTICDDYKFTRAKINNETKDVYDVHDGVLKNTYNLIENYNNDVIDDYYMLINKDWLSSSYINIMRATAKDGKTTYKFGLSNAGVRDVLSYYNQHIRLSSDPTKQHINVFEIAEGFNTKKSSFEIVTNTSGDIESIDIEFKGFYDMALNDDVVFTFKLKIRFDYSKAAYEIPTKMKDITLPNYDVIG